MEPLLKGITKKEISFLHTAPSPKFNLAALPNILQLKIGPRIPPLSTAETIVDW